MTTRRQLEYLYRAWDGSLLWRGGGWVLVAGVGGPCFLATGAPADPRPVDVDPYEPFDEAFFLPGTGRFVFAGYDGSRVTLRIVRPAADATTVEEDRLVADLPGPVGELRADGDDLVVVDPGPGDRDIRLRLLRGRAGWSVQVHSAPLAPGAGVAITGTARGVVRRQDRTPHPPLYHLHHRDGAVLATWESHTWAHTRGRLHWAAQADGRYGIVTDGRFLPSPGYVRTLMADDRGGLLAVVAAGGAETLHRVTGDGFTPLTREPGRKLLSRTPEGVAVLNLDHCDGISARWPDGTTDILGGWRRQPARIGHHRSPDGAEAVVIDPPDGRVHATVLHLHGGPDSYEVPELRFFGVLRDLTDRGVRVVGLNYRGSSAITPEAVTSAWKRWHRTVPEDLAWLWAADLIRGDCVAMGWSFGATLALCAAAQRPEIVGVVAGAAMTDLGRHRARAAAQDARYVSWFDERFGPAGGPCEEFFALARRLDRPVPVLSLHGVDDQHCSYPDAMALVAAARDRGYPWRHHDLPGAGHHVTVIEDALLIHDETSAFIGALLGSPGTPLC
jgi:dipeptidyl aminopeptidase/acylaminoacyl peptidase